MEKLKELTEQEVVYGLKCGELLAKLDQDTSLLKTAQCCLFGDLNELSSTFPKSGIASNGNVYGLRNLATTIKESDFTVLPTPSKSDALIILRHSLNYEKYYSNNHQDKTLYQCQLNGLTAEATMQLYEWMMGFPMNWTKVE